MKKRRFFAKNLEREGRIVRGVTGLVLLVAGLLLFKLHWIAAVATLASSAFVLFEASRGWCVMRACGVKTKF